MEPNLISDRRRKVEQEIARLKSLIEEYQAELAELTTAERVIARLSGDVEPLQEESDEIVASVGKPPNTPTIPSMIVAALRDARQNGAPGLEPIGMTSFIAQTWWPNVPSTAVSPIAWRMWKRGQLRKDGPIYMLPEIEATDDQSVGDTSAASDQQPGAQGREAGPGGGT